ncbi:MAG TPA: 50S ribosomal protein L28 [bacterium]|nr:50S ribosomal protein L28 [bacterium]
MSRKCEICGKKPQFGHRISHSHNLSKRRFNPNIRKMRVIMGGTRKRINICTDCLSSGKVERV